LLFIIDFLSYISYFYTFIHEFKISLLIHKNIEIINKQVCFKAEVQNLIKISKNCNSLNYIKIPIVYQYITDKYSDVIMMEFINGKTIHEIEKEDYDIYAKMLLKFGFITSIIHGFSHGDLHCGNILFLKERKNSSSNAEFIYKLGILDFGIMLQIKEQFKNNLIEIACDIFQVSPEDTAKKILESGLILQPLSIIQQLDENQKRPLLNIFIFTLKECLKKKNNINQVQIYKFINLLYSKLNDISMSTLEINLSDDFIKTQLVITMVHGITMKLCNDNYIELADNIINELFHTDLFLDFNN
jgi:predicted unusual protein kinase regulating ubiquinone biosynthesis (AarF/ABC1/UbiB family)